MYEENELRNGNEKYIEVKESRVRKAKHMCVIPVVDRP